MEHGLTDRGEAEVAWFDNAGVNWAHRYFEDPLAFRNEMRERVGRLDRDAPRPVERLAELEDALRPPVVDHEGAGVGVSPCDDPEQALDLAPLPVLVVNPHWQQGTLAVPRIPP